LLSFVIGGCAKNEIHNGQVHVFDLGQDGQKFDGVGTGIIKPILPKDASLRATCVTDDEKIIVTIVNAKSEMHSATIQLRNVPQGLRVKETLTSEANGNRDVKMIFVCGEYNFNITLPGYSTLAVLCELQ
jgi:hypothetical protein